jgi:hypothetical protein
MVEEIFKKQNNDLSLPEESFSVIEKTLEKFKLNEEEENSLEKFIMSKSPEEKKQIFENLPGTKMSQIIKDYGEQKISLNEIPGLIEKNLNVSKQEAKEITKYLNENLLGLIKGIDNNKSYIKKPIKETFSKTEPDSLPKTEKLMDNEEKKETLEEPENNSIEEDESAFLNEEMMKIREKYRKKPIKEKQIIKEKKEIKKDKPKKPSKDDSYREPVE